MIPAVRMVKNMFKIAPLLYYADRIRGWLYRKACRQWQPKYRTILRIEELEVRLVPTLLGQQLFPADYPWNQDISNAPVAVNSAAVIAHIGSSIGIHPALGTDSANN